MVVANERRWKVEDVEWSLVAVLFRLFVVVGGGRCLLVLVGRVITVEEVLQWTMVFGDAGKVMVAADGRRWELVAVGRESSVLAAVV